MLEKARKRKSLKVIPVLKLNYLTQLLLACFPYIYESLFYKFALSLMHPCTTGLSETRLAIEGRCAAHKHSAQDQTSYLADNILHQLVHSEADVGVDGEHLPQRVLVLRGVDVPVQQAPHHVQEGGVVFLQLHLTCGGEKWR